MGPRPAPQCPRPRPARAASAPLHVPVPPPPRRIPRPAPPAIRHRRNSAPGNRLTGPAGNSAPDPAVPPPGVARPAARSGAPCRVERGGAGVPRRAPPGTFVLRNGERGVGARPAGALRMRGHVGGGGGGGAGAPRGPPQVGLGPRSGTGPTATLPQDRGEGAREAPLSRSACPARSRPFLGLGPLWAPAPGEVGALAPGPVHLPMRAADIRQSASPS